MKTTKETIDKQLEQSEHFNLFHRDIINSLKFSSETLKLIKNIDSIDANSERLLIDYLTNKTIESCYKTNQYYNFSIESQKDLKNLYVELFNNLRSKKSMLQSIQDNHYKNLISWLQKSNIFAESIYSTKATKLDPVVCSEYSPELQLEVLNIKLNHLIEPILDIGCGKEGNLVSYFRQNGIEAYGLDRSTSNTSVLFNADWLDFSFKANKWGTIISNLGFSNHFHHHNLRNDGNFVGYAKKYMDILNSLKKNGSFHYAPSLPFIEQYLDASNFDVRVQGVADLSIATSIVTKLA